MDLSILFGVGIIVLSAFLFALLAWNAVLLHRGSALAARSAHEAHYAGKDHGEAA